MITLKSEGLDALVKKFDTLSKESQSKVQSALNSWADDTATDAKMIASSNSADTGYLMNSIRPVYGNGGASVVVSAEYAPYVEFGTRKYASSYVGSLPSDWNELASQFKGKSPTGGDFKQFVNNLKEWARRTGKLDPDYAYAAAQKILREGLKARPFLYPAVLKNLPQLEKDLKEVFK
jgi:hypothetical protein